MFQVGLGAGCLAEAFFRETKQRLNFPKSGAKFDGGAKLRGGLRVVALEIERYAKIGVRIDIIRIELQDRIEFACGQIGFALPEELLRLAGMGIDLLLFGGGGLGEGWRGELRRRYRCRRKPLPEYSCP